MIAKKARPLLKPGLVVFGNTYPQKALTLLRRFFDSAEAVETESPKRPVKWKAP